MDVLIYSCEHGDFDKHGNVFHMCDIARVTFTYVTLDTCKTLFPIACVKGKQLLRVLFLIPESRWRQS